MLSFFFSLLWLRALFYHSHRATIIMFIIILLKEQTVIPFHSTGGMTATRNCEAFYVALGSRKNTFWFERRLPDKTAFTLLSVSLV